MSCQSTPTQAPPPSSAPTIVVPTATPAPQREQIHFTEEYFSELAFAYANGLAHDGSDRVTRVTVNVQCDQEIYWKLWAEQYCVDVLIDIVPLMGSYATVENGRIEFPVFDLQWLGLQFTPGTQTQELGEPLTAAIYGLQDAVSAALNQELQAEGWTPVAVTMDDEKLIVTVERR